MNEQSAFKSDEAIMIRKTWQLGLLGVMLLSIVTVALGKEGIVVASLDRMDGVVNVMQTPSGRTIQGRNGLLLRAGDTVVTMKKTRVSIKFRDGSEVRMFPNSRFVIQSVKETPTGKRTFLHKLFLGLGSAWANFVPQRQVATITTPTATIGIKGTTFRITERNNKSRVALTEGLVSVSNDRTEVNLTPGKRLTDFTRTDNLKKKITTIPFKVDVKSNKRKLSFSSTTPEEAFLTLQLIDIKTGKQINRSGRIYLRSNYQRVIYPKSASLNQRGFARVPISFAPPESSDENLDGNIYVWALMDEESADDTAEGRILFTFPVKAGKDKIRIDSQSGKGKRVR